MELAQRCHQVYRILFPEWKEHTCKSDPRFGNADGASTVSRVLRGEDLCGCTRLPSPVAIHDLGLPAERATPGSLGPNLLRSYDFGEMEADSARCHLSPNVVIGCYESLIS